MLSALRCLLGARTSPTRASIDQRPGHCRRFSAEALTAVAPPHGDPVTPPPRRRIPAMSATAAIEARAGPARGGLASLCVGAGRRRAFSGSPDIVVTVRLSFGDGHARDVASKRLWSLILNMFNDPNPPAKPGSPRLVRVFGVALGPTYGLRRARGRFHRWHVGRTGCMPECEGHHDIGYEGRRKANLDLEVLRAPAWLMSVSRRLLGACPQATPSRTLQAKAIRAVARITPLREESTPWAASKRSAGPLSLGRRLQLERLARRGALVALALA